MNLTYLRNDLRTHRGTNLVLLVVLALSAFLMATGAMVMERMFGSVNALFAQAKPPDFLQMHTGEYDAAALDAFADAHPEVEAWLIEDMVGFDSAALSWSHPGGASGTMADSLISNLFVTQNAEFDFLLDETGAIAQPTGSQVLVPVAYQLSYGLLAGDELRVQASTGALTFTIAGFVRDAQMASSLSSGTRFVVSETGFTQLLGAGGSPEIIVEYRLRDPSAAPAFQTAYQSDDALPKNGQAITGDIILLINSVSGGLVAIALVFVSVLLIAIALLNVRFVIRGSLHDEVRQIGAMKAIGLPNATISALYLVKYAAMTFLGCLIGGVGALFAARLLTQGVETTYAAAPVTAWTVLVPVIALVAVFLVVLAICHLVLRRINRIEVVNALVHGSTLTERQVARRAKRVARRVRHSAFASWRGGSLNRRLAWVDLKAEAGQWALLPTVFILAAVLIAVPTNLLTTFESPRFVTYMGAPQADLRADLLFFDDIEQVRAGLDAAFAADPRLTQVHRYANELVEVLGRNGWESLHIEVGDYSSDTVEFVRGGRPSPGEIALSVLNADQFGVDVGDNVTIRRAGAEVGLRIAGIYQDVTSGGRTAKLEGEPGGTITGYVYYAWLAAGQDPAAIADEYGQLFPAASIVPMGQFVTQTLSFVTNAFRSAALLALVFAVGVAALITTLYLNLQLSREQRRCGVLSALGFSGGELAGQLRLKAVVTVAAGTVLGLVIAATLGEKLVGWALSLAGLGLTSLSFIPNPWLVWLAYPLLLIAAAVLSAWAVSSRLKRDDTSVWLRA